MYCKLWSPAINAPTFDEENVIIILATLTRFLYEMLAEIVFRTDYVFHFHIYKYHTEFCRRCL